MVQAIGVELLQRQDNIERGEQMAEEFRLARIAAGVKPADVFPEYFTEPGQVLDPGAEDALDEEDVDYDYSGVEWEGPSDIQPDEMALLGEFLDDTRVSVAERDVSGSGEWV